MAEEAGRTQSPIFFNATTTTTSVLIPLSRLAGVGNFCFNSLSPFLSIVRILSSQAISFQILLYTLFPRFPWSPFLPFPSYFKLHNLMYLGVDVSTDNMTISPQTVLNYHIFYLHNDTHLIPKKISRHPLDQSHPTHPGYTTLCNLASSATLSFHVSQQYNKTGLTQH